MSSQGSKNSGWLQLTLCNAGGEGAEGLWSGSITDGICLSCSSLQITFLWGACEVDRPAACSSSGSISGGQAFSPTSCDGSSPVALESSSSFCAHGWFVQSVSLPCSSVHDATREYLASAKMDGDAFGLEGLEAVLARHSIFLRATALLILSPSDVARRWRRGRRRRRRKRWRMAVVLSGLELLLRGSRWLELVLALALCFEQLCMKL